MLLSQAPAIRSLVQWGAESFGVSREAVRKWKNTFGNVMTYYSVHPEVQRFMEKQSDDAASEEQRRVVATPMIEIVLD